MNKRIRQYFGLLSAVLAYYLIHEGAQWFRIQEKGFAKIQNGIFREQN